MMDDDGLEWRQSLSLDRLEAADSLSGRLYVVMTAEMVGAFIEYTVD